MPLCKLACACCIVYANSDDAGSDPLKGAAVTCTGGLFVLSRAVVHILNACIAACAVVVVVYVYYTMYFSCSYVYE